MRNGAGEVNEMDQSKQTGKAPSLYELRTYRIDASRPQAMHQRMRDGLLPLFRRHSIPVAGCWQAITGDDLPKFVYLVRWPAMAERDAAWAGFYADAEWLELRERTNAGSNLVLGSDTRFFSAGASSPQGGLDQTQDSLLHELRTYNFPPGAKGEAHRHLRDAVLPKIADQGGTVLASLDPKSGSSTQIAVFIAWNQGWAENLATLCAMPSDSRSAVAGDVTLAIRHDSILLAAAGYIGKG
jgi:hypothetical protein